MSEYKSASELAHSLNVSASTIANWTTLKSDPLRTVLIDDKVAFTTTDYEKFAMAHASLRGVRKQGSRAMKSSRVDKQARRYDSVQEVSRFASKLARRLSSIDKLTQVTRARSIALDLQLAAARAELSALQKALKAAKSRE